MSIIKIKNILSRDCQRGFTLVEMLAAVFVFSILAVIVGTFMVRALQIERQSFSAQVIQENALATLELMAKEIRVSRVESQNNNCTTDPVLNQLTIIHPIEGTIIYRLNGNGIVERVLGSDVYYLSSNEVIFNRLRFCVSGSTLPSDDQPSRVAILVSISNTEGGRILTTELQTMITSRYAVNEQD